MSAVPVPSSTPAQQPSLLKALQAGLQRSLEEIFNLVFSPSTLAASNRLALRQLFLLGMWLFWTAAQYDLNGWQEVWRPFGQTLADWNLSTTLLGLVFAPRDYLPLFFSGLQAFIIQLFVFLFRTAFSPEVLRHLLALLAPYFLMRRLIAVYLADVFEKEPNVAQRFLLAAAFGENYPTVRLTEGKILEDHQGTTLVQIGGPGYLTIDLDSAVLLERPDGSTHILGPTAPPPAPKRSWFAKLFLVEKTLPDQPVKGKVAIDAFERIRQCVDLRTISASQTVSARSRDGIPITARDLQYTYSIYRGEAPQPTNLQPYPFDPQALEKMVYNPPRPLKMDGAPDTTPDWSKKMLGGIAGNVANELGGFISQRSLSEFFTAIGRPEEEALQARASGVLTAGRSLAGEGGPAADPIASPLKAPETFTSRATLSEQILGELQKRLPGAGKQVHWLGIGTWDVPPETTIPARHLEAWNLSLENRRLNSPDVLTKLYNDAHQNELIGLLRQMPLETYQEWIMAVQEGKKSESEAVSALLDSYYERLLAAEKYLQEHSGKVPFHIQETISRLAWLQQGDNAPNEYFIGYRILAAPSEHVRDATVYQVETIFSAQPLPRYFCTSRLFEFGDSEQLDFSFEVTASAGILNPQGMRFTPMRRRDLYCSAVFELALSPGQTAALRLVYGQGASDLGHFEINLPS